MSKTINALDAIRNRETPPRWRPPQVRWSDDRQRFFQRKYVLDILVGILLLILLSPVIGGLWILVKLTSRGPGFYRQVRVGLNGREFQVVKLRSMKTAAESGEEIWACKKDPRITRLGVVLRKLHLDELPQLFNVAIGQMSLIGPRPERPKICNQLADKIDGYYSRVCVKPGITGLSQINLPPDESLDDVMRKQVLDLAYINETNLWLELRILLATALRIVGIKGETVMKWMRLCRRDVLVKHGLEKNDRDPVEPRRVPAPIRARSSHETKPRESTPRYAMAGDVDLDDDSIDSSSTSGIMVPR